MVISVCRTCNERFAVSPTNPETMVAEDYVHRCNSGNPTLDNEDVVVVGTATDDWDGSVPIVKNKVAVMYQGSENELWGTRAWVEGADVDPKTDRGNRATTTRVRQRFTYKETTEERDPEDSI